MNNPKKLFVGLYLLSIIACGQLFSEGDGSGSGTETTNALSGVLSDPHGKFLANTTVKAFKFDSLNFEFIDSTLSDKNGKYEINLPSAKYIIQAKKDSITYSDTLTLDSDKKVDATLNQSASIQLVTNENFTDSIDIWFYPSAIQKQVALDQSNSLIEIPMGSYLVYLKKYTADRSQFQLLDILEHSVQNAIDTIEWQGLHSWGDSGLVVFDDFEDGNSFHYNNLIWWSFNDSGLGNKSIIKNPQSENFVQYDSLSNNKGFIQIDAILDSTNTRGYVGIGTNFYRPQPSLNVPLKLTGLQSLNLDIALNKGKARIGFRSKITNGWSLSWEITSAELNTDTLQNKILAVDSAQIAAGYSSSDLPYLLALNDEFMILLDSDIPGDSLQLLVDNIYFEF